jgi:hypothetical protein
MKKQSREKAATGLQHSKGKLFLAGGQAVVADATYFGAGDRDLDVAIAGDLTFELLVETGFEFADLAAAETGDVDVIARAVGLVVMAIAAEVQEVEFVDQSLTLEEIDGAVDGDEVDVGIYFLGAIEDLVDVEVLFGGVHHLQDDAALAGETDPAFTESVLEMADGSGGIDAFAAGDAMGGCCRHGAILE